MMKYAAIELNDTANAPGFCVSVWLQGCPHRCKGCFNPETWDFSGGKPFGINEMNSILKGISANGMLRNLCVMGGEPLCEENLFTTAYILRSVREQYNDSIDIYLWTGYTLQDLKERKSNTINGILEDLDYLIDGPFVESLKDINLELRGSSNQKIYCLKK